MIITVVPLVIFPDCDTPLLTFEALLSKLSSTEKFDWILVTGDLPGHDVYNQTKEDNAHIIGLEIHWGNKRIIKFFSFPDARVLPRDAFWNGPETNVSVFYVIAPK